MNQTTIKKSHKKTLSSSVQLLSLEDLDIKSQQKKATDNVGFSIWIRSLLQNWRQGTVACKGRSDVARSNRKPWKQKGTGRARAGSARSPLWRGGGVTFGPQARVRKLTISKKTKKNIMNSILFNYIEQGKIFCLDWTIESDQPKTALAYAALKNANLHDRNITIFLSSNDMVTYASLINIPTVKILFFDQANAFDLVNNTQWVVLRKNLDQFKEMVSLWI